MKTRIIKRGSKIGISSPASLPEHNALKKGIEILKNIGFEVVIGESCYKQLSEKEKVSELQYLSAECDLIMCSRGGNGSYRLIDHISEPFKPLCGYSDITSLLFLQHKLGVMSFHSPMVVEFHKNRESLNFLIEVISGAMEPPFEYPKKLNALTLKRGKATGKLLVGNLSLIVTVMNQIGTDIFNDSILILEDVDESLDSIDRMLWSLSHELKNRIKSIVFAGLTRIKKGSNNYRLIDVLKYHVEYLNVPSFIGFPAYHGNFFKYTLPVGAKIEIDAEQCSLKLLSFE